MNDSTTLIPSHPLGGLVCSALTKRFLVFGINKEFKLFVKATKKRLDLEALHQTNIRNGMIA